MSKRMTAIGTNDGVVSEEEVNLIYQGARLALRKVVDDIDAQERHGMAMSMYDDYLASLPVESGW